MNKHNHDFCDADIEEEYLVCAHCRGNGYVIDELSHDGYQTCIYCLGSGHFTHYLIRSHTSDLVR